ncbi:MAG: LacI family DNA-binding transcriptional regulator, partial [Nocardioidaceae bacterium]
MVHGRSRADAWAATLSAAGLPEGPCVEADFSAEAGAAATRQLLDLPEPPTAIVYANDLMAIAGLAVAVGRGIDVPGDLSIAGYENTELAAHLQPPLTTVSTDVIGWGRAAARRLLELIDERPATEVDLEPPRLVVRGSTGPAPG